MPCAGILRSLSLKICVSSVCLSLHQHSSVRGKKPLRLSLLVAASAMDSQLPCLLVLCGKSSAEKELAESLKHNNALRLAENAELSILLHSEIETPLEENTFRSDLFLNSLSTTCFGRFLIWSPRLPSTHDVISHNFCQLPIGAVCVADVQFKGRGWNAKQFLIRLILDIYNPDVVKMEDGRMVPLVQYVVSLAVTEAIKFICQKNALPHLDVRIKWPNDLYLNGLKVGGILCTSTYKSKKFNISAGIGLNIDNEKPSTCLNSELKKLTSVACQLKREEILAAFFNKFENLFDLFVNKGFQCLEKLYYETWLHSGQRVIIQEKDKDQLVERAVIIQGLTSSGYLLAVDDNNQMCELHPDGNSFDFFKGLVRRKMT